MMSLNVKNYSLSAVILLLLTINSFACRFTIRDIGYSRLNVETYLVQLYADTSANKDLLRTFKEIAYVYSIKSNINYKISHRIAQVPQLECTNSKGDVVLKRVTISSEAVQDFYNTLLFSPLQRMMYNEIDNAFAFIIGFYDKNDKNIDSVIDNALIQFEKISSNLDKEVKERVIKIIIPDKKRLQEACILRSMGISSDDKPPVVVVLYGRGRLTDKPLSGKDITTVNLLNRLVMLGTDCECGIDLSPLLQSAIPFNWDKKMSRDIAGILGFDVENPMILIEMSQILSKEPLETGKSEFSYAPQIIDLDQTLGKINKNREDIKAPPNYVLSITMISFTVLSVMIIGIGLFLFKKRRKI